MEGLSLIRLATKIVLQPEMATANTGPLEGA